jgi:hypothetical protein
LRGCTVSDAIARCDAEEFREWMAFYELDPWGGERGDLRTGIVASVIANVNRPSGSKPITPSDFMPEFGPRDEERKTQSLAEMKAAFESFAR